MGITTAVRTAALAVIQKIAYATTPDAYDALYQELVNSMPAAVIQYYNNNWHEIRNEWVLGFKFSNRNFMNATNNRLENFNGKLKVVLDYHSSLEKFLEHFYIVLNSLRNEHDHRAANLIQKRIVSNFTKDSCEYRYSEFLTNYAWSFIAKQLALRMTVKLQQIDMPENFLVDSVEGILHVTASACQCMFRKSMNLPCRHILAARASLNVALFDEALCDIRWTKAYYMKHQRVLTETLTSQSSTGEVAGVSVQSSHQSLRPLSQNQKYRLAVSEITELASLMSEASGSGFEDRLKIIRKLKEGWRNNCVMLVSELAECDTVQTQQRHNVLSNNVSATTLSVSGTNDDYSHVLQFPSLSVGSALESRIDGVQNDNVHRGPSLNDETIEPVEPNVLESFSPEVVNSSHPWEADHDYDGLKKQRCTVLSDIRLPPHIKRRGRPKGINQTVIGILKKTRNVVSRHKQYQCSWPSRLSKTTTLKNVNRFKHLDHAQIKANSVLQTSQAASGSCSVYRSEFMVPTSSRRMVVLPKAKLKVGNSNLTEVDLRSLLPGNWVTDMV